MGIILDHVAPWGRSFEDYVAMFALSESDLQTRILSCADGPAAFNAEMHVRGRRIVSADPLYTFSPEEIRSRIEAICGTILQRVRQRQEHFVWDAIRSPEELGRVRIAAMETFLDDFARGAREGRYVAAALPSLPFGRSAFDVALCSHFLFTYSDLLSAKFHLDTVLEMCRVAGEVRIFPLLDADNTMSRHVDVVRKALTERGYAVSIRVVPYMFQVGGNKMMVVNERGQLATGSRSVSNGCP
ncbi:MAG: SAM-dependent methyltransferase [Planctomycetota bacterium]